MQFSYQVCLSQQPGMAGFFLLNTTYEFIMNDNTSVKNKVIVVLGAGRCGTSLLMQILSKIGMSVSKRLVKPRAHNLAGPMEDLNLAATYDDFLRTIGSNRLLPFSIDQVSNETQIELQRKLRRLLKANLQDSNSIWGFKDPYTSNLLPYWYRVFNKEGVIPVFILAVRDPAHAAISRKKHFGSLESISELAWLVNYTEAILHTTSDFFIVHYEDWFSDAENIVQGLLDYTGLDRFCPNKPVSEMIDGVINPNYNRSSHFKYNIHNRYVKKLYKALRQCQGNEFNRNSLIKIAKECSSAISDFMGWYQQAQIFNSRENELIQGQKGINDLKKELHETNINLKELKDQKSEYQRKITDLDKDMQDLLNENKHLVIQNTDLKDKIEFYKKKIASKKHGPKNKRKLSSAELNQNKRWKKEYLILKYSYSFRLGQILINAVKSPGRNTILFPYYFTQLLWDMISGKGREKAKAELSKQLYL